MPPVASVATTNTTPATSDMWKVRTRTSTRIIFCWIHTALAAQATAALSDRATPRQSSVSSDTPSISHRPENAPISAADLTSPGMRRFNTAIITATIGG